MTKKKDPRRVDGGQYYGRTFAGRLVPIGDCDVAPAAVICRRVADFPPGTLPSYALIVPCTACGELVATNPDGPHRDRPRICMQCEHVEPLPFDDEAPR